MSGPGLVPAPRLALGALLAGLALAAPHAALAQRPVRTDTVRALPRARPPGQDTVRRDTARADTSRQGRSVPTAPSREFQPPDSVTQALLVRPGFRVTRYAADSVRLFAEEKEIRLAGSALIQREATILEADSVRYVEATCDLFAVGGPKLFDATGNVAGEGMRYDACDRAGIVSRAATDFQEGSAMWHLRGDFAVDNLLDRTYASRADITSCDLPDAHYHFAARQVKYVSKRLMVSRPAVLYVADVPVLWLPFIFQDMRRGRRSGLIPPQFGINDIVRNSPSYQRHIANLGYYWVLSDYADAQTTFDWYAQRFIALNGRLRYRWLDRFLSGGLNYQDLRETGGSTSRRISWSHQQQFSLATQLTAFVDYASSSRVISRNAVDPVLAVATIDSRLNFQHRFPWGTLALGGSRTQSLDKPAVSMTFPTISFTPNPIEIRPNWVWSPGFSLTNSLQNDYSAQALFPGPGPADSLFVDSRSTSISFSSPLRIGRWNWPNSFAISDQWTNRRETIRVRDPNDTTRFITRTYAESFETSLDWNTGISLPVLLQGTWNFAPSIQIVNTTGGPFMIRNRFSGGGFVSQGKRLGYAASISPTFFALFRGVGPIARIRHSIAPSLSWSYAPAATIPEEYARAVSRGGAINRRSDPRQTVSIGLSQNFEGKLRPPPRAPGDTTPLPADGEEQGRKIRLLSIASSGFSFDIEQAKKPGRTAWLTDQFTNTFQSDLLRGFSLSTSHDLWYGPVGFVGSRFRPALTSVSMGFQLGAGTLRTVGSLLGVRAPARPAAAERDSVAADTASRGGSAYINPFQRGPMATRYSAIDRLGAGGGGDFSGNLTFNLQRQRLDPPADTSRLASNNENAMLAGSVTFRPTRHWNVSWQTGYNVTRREFSDHVLRLDRDLHDWRATFTFVKSPNGNFLFSFFIQLIDQPEIKFDYDQRNYR